MNNSEAYKDMKFAKPIKSVKPTKKRINNKSKTSRNTSRSLNAVTTENVFKRDGYKCIIPECTNKNLDPLHHAWFGLEANRTPNRNQEDQLCCLCHEHHSLIHHGCRIVEIRGMTLREYCKFYLNNYYKKGNK